ncbi:hypothetical protein CVT26_014846 [Gymnopilus dilepis]|uniref:Uncharacterized protein n=1 Tax=Gymnopilus dilepis TaxID=231916 RepID=A0A409XWY2_9AGAR|nr:hypothetical protein CVT26_014846 [Gymnopilus dilepis]
MALAHATAPVVAELWKPAVMEILMSAMALAVVEPLSVVVTALALVMVRAQDVIWRRAVMALAPAITPIMAVPWNVAATEILMKGTGLAAVAASDHLSPNKFLTLSPF